MKLTYFYSLLLIYAIVIASFLVYFVLLQQFGAKGLQFSMGGRDSVFNIFDLLTLILLPIATALFVISFMAFMRKNDKRLFITSIAFFFFLAKQVLDVFQNFFPSEFIFVGNAESALELLILISFVFLLYKK